MGPPSNTAVDDLRAQLQSLVKPRYTIERELGRGGMSTVFLAHDVRHNRRVALKVLRPELAAWIGRDRFVREIRITAGFDHPHILPVLDSGGEDQGGALWYTMPYVQGESLRERLQREGRLGSDEVVRLTTEVADALSYAHRRGVVHRDIKPENILLSEGHARVADFGIARAIHTVDGGPGPTETGLVVGTPAYMSPEQSAGGSVDERSDVYALGCVTYEMLSGRPPHQGATPQAIIARRYREPYPSGAADISDNIHAVLRRALATEAAERYPGAADYAAALTEAAKRPSRRALRPRPGRALTFVSSFGLVLVAVLGWVLRHRDGDRGTAASATRGPLRIAVMPFVTLGDTSRAYLTDGMADAIRGRLAALSSLEVIASSSTEQYRQSRKPLREIGRELGVPYVLIGRVRWVGNGAEQMQVSPELVQVASGATRWQDVLQAGTAQAPTLPAEIAQAVVGALGVPVSASARAALKDTFTTNPEAYELYLRANDFLHRISQYQAPTTMLQPAMAMLRRAIALDSGFARAKVHLARALRYDGIISGGDTTRYAEADSLLSAVLAEHPTMAEAIEIRASLRQTEGDLKSALQLYQEAAALEPSNAEILSEITFLQALRLDSASLVTGARAVALAPRDPEMLKQVIAGTMIFHHTDQLERYSDLLIELDASDPMGYVHKAIALLWKSSDTADALAVLRRSETVISGIPELVGWVYAMCGPSGWERWHTLRLSDLASPEGRDTAEYYWYQGQIAGAEHRVPTQRAYADSLLEHTRKVKRTDPFYPVAMAQQAWTRGVRHENAAARHDLAVAEAAFSKRDPSYRNFFMYFMASAYVAGGDTLAAIGATRRLLELPSAYTRRTVALAPEFVGLHGVAAFERLLVDTTLP